MSSNTTIVYGYSWPLIRNHPKWAPSGLQVHMPGKALLLWRRTRTSRRAGGEVQLRSSPKGISPAALPGVVVRGVPGLDNDGVRGFPFP